MVTRGFFGRKPPSELAHRIPPGQHLVDDFPVLSAGPTPRIALEKWSFTLKSGPKPVAKWDWAKFVDAATDKADPRHPLRHDVVQAEHIVGRGDDRRHPGGSRNSAADRLCSRSFPRRLFHQYPDRRPDRWQRR